MLNSVNNSSPSFGARFLFEGCRYTPDRIRENIERDPEVARGVVDFVNFIQSEEGRNILKQMPEEDKIVLSVPIRYTNEPGKSEELYVDMKHSSKSAGGNFSDKPLPFGTNIEEFKKWADSIIKKEDITSMAKILNKQFVIDDTSGESSKKIMDGGFFRVPEESDL